MKSFHLKQKILLFFILLITYQFLSGQIKVDNLRTEYLEDPVGIDITTPRFYWKLSSEQQNQVQTAYQILVSSSPTTLNSRKADMWNSGKVDSDQSIHVEYAGRDLQSRDRCWWTVRAWDKDGKPSKWSEPAYFEMGLLSQDDWKAQWIKTSIKFDEYSYPCPMMRKEFQLKKKIKQARVYVTSLGLYEFHINGKKAGDCLLTPGFTSYLKRLQYQVYDITSMLQQGKNAAGIILGNGWYRNFRAYGPMAPNREERERQDLEALAQIEVIYTDGTKEIITTDGSWKSSTGPILMTSIYDGETYDATLEEEGWTKPDFDDRDWKPVEVVTRGMENLVATIGPMVKRMEEIEPVEVIYTPEGDTVLDMGQNMVGWCRLKVNCPRGTNITLRHAEVLDKYGNFYTANLRSAKQTITYTCNGNGLEVYEPRFTFQGFRFVAVSGYPGEVTPDLLTGVVIYNDMKQTGYFHCNDSLINRLYENTVWTGKGNSVEVPTDCPQRDERMGWLGDAALYIPTACYNFMAPGFYTKWMKDIAADQEPSGLVHRVAPNKLWDREGTPGWGDGVTIVPWTLYEHYGDKRILEVHYKNMKKWVDFITESAEKGREYVWKEKGRFGPGDWLAYSSERQVDNRNDYPGASTDKDFLGTAYYYHSTDILVKSARLLGNNEDVAEYEKLRDNIRTSFINEFLTTNGRLSPSTQSAYAIALFFNIIPEYLTQDAASRIVENISDIGHITTGILGTQKLLPALTEQGYIEDSYKLLFSEKYPSWLYQVLRGGTTVWERWDGIRIDSTFQTTQMNSFNHPALAAVGEWMYKYAGGIQSANETAGFKEIRIKPFPGGKMNDVKTSYESLYGTIQSNWKTEDGKFKLFVEIPVNTKATVHIPCTGNSIKVNGKSHQNTEKAYQQNLPYHFQSVELGSGKYNLESVFEL